MEQVRAPVPLGDVEVHDVWSEEVGDAFRLFVGRCGQTPAAALFVTDANGLFGLALDTVRLMQLPALVPPLLVVGIGYPTAATIADTVGIRVRDLTPTPVPAFERSGGADAFLRFVHGELFPTLERTVPGCLAERIYFGHSLGGLLGVHALLSAPDTFDHYLVSSPSLWWDHHEILERARRGPEDGLVGHAFFGIGGEETDEGRRREARHLPGHHPAKPPRAHLDMVEDLVGFVRMLRVRHPRLALDAVVMPGEFHSTVAGTVLSRGLRWIFQRR